MDAQETKTGTGIGMKISIVAVLILAIAGVVVLKGKGRSPISGGNTEQIGTENAVPKLIDFGAGTCVPCKMMEPILKDLKKKYTGKMEVQIIDIKKDPEAKEQYGITIIPTQIFFDSSGRELFRHKGFISKEDILTKWKELGVEFERGAIDNDQKEKNTDSPEILPGNC